MSTEHPPARPAATVLLLREGTGSVEVFMVDRHREMAGFGGARVFPGGRVDDVDIALAARLPGLGLAPDSVPFRIAAIRETFEEAGILLARPAGSVELISGARLATLEAARHAVHETPAEFPELLARENLTLAVDLLVPYAHWITPVIARKRYDTHFFAVVAPVDQIASHDGGESVHSLWVSPRQALADGAAGKCQIEFATRMNLQPILNAPTVSEALAVVRQRRVVTVLPEITLGETRTIRLPPDAGYGGEYFTDGR